MAARALNPLVAADMSNVELADTLRDLTSYGFDELCPAAIQDLIDKIPKHRAAITYTRESFWSGVEGAEKYDHDLSKKKEKNLRSILIILGEVIVLNRLVVFGSGGAQRLLSWPFSLLLHASL